jgi:hypothetical protein
MLEKIGEPGGNRTRDHRIKSAVTAPLQAITCRKQREKLHFCCTELH